MTETWGCRGLGDDAEWGSMAALSGSRRQLRRKHEEERVKFQAGL